MTAAQGPRRAAPASHRGFAAASRTGFPGRAKSTDRRRSPAQRYCSEVWLLLVHCESGLKRRPGSTSLGARSDVVDLMHGPFRRSTQQFHARHTDGSAKVRIDTLEVIESNLGRRQLRFVLAWAELHQDELRENWRRARIGEKIQSIEPLR